jgi:hypothetical protein
VADEISLRQQREIHFQKVQKRRSSQPADRRGNALTDPLFDYDRSQGDETVIGGHDYHRAKMPAESWRRSAKSPPAKDRNYICPLRERRNRQNSANRSTLQVG